MLPSDYKELQKQFERQRLEQQEAQRMQSPYYLSQQNRGVQYQTRVTDVYKENDNVYANIVIDHPPVTYPLVATGATSGVAPVDAKYDVTKNTAIIDKANDYYCSVIRFVIPLNTTPLMVMPIVPGQANADLTPYVLGIVYNGVNYPVNLIYLPANTMNPPPPPVDTAPIYPYQIITPYYFVYEYELLIRMTNLAIRQAYIDSGLAAAVPAIPPPYFFLDPVTNLMSLVMHTMWTNLFAPLTDVPKLYMNSELFGFFDSFYASFQGYDQPAGRDFIFITAGPAYPTENMGYAPFGVAPTSPPTYFKFTEEYSVLEYWSSLRKILITSSTLPVNPEYVPTINNVGDLNVSFPIISDFIPSIEGSAGTSRSIAYYIPQSQYRLIDLVSDNPVQKIDIQIYWQDKDGNNYPLQLSSTQQISIKLGFFRKDLYKNTGNLLK